MLEGEHWQRPPLYMYSCYASYKSGPKAQGGYEAVIKLLVKATNWHVDASAPSKDVVASAKISPTDAVHYVGKTDENVVVSVTENVFIVVTHRKGNVVAVDFFCMNLPNAATTSAVGNVGTNPIPAEPAVSVLHHALTASDDKIPFESITGSSQPATDGTKIWSVTAALPGADSCFIMRPPRGLDPKIQGELFIYRCSITSWRGLSPEDSYASLIRLVEQTQDWTVVAPPPPNAGWRFSRFQSVRGNAQLIVDQNPAKEILLGIWKQRPDLIAMPDPVTGPNSVPEVPAGTQLGQDSRLPARNSKADPPSPQAILIISTLRSAVAGVAEQPPFRSVTTGQQGRGRTKSQGPVNSLLPGGARCEVQAAPPPASDPYYSCIWWTLGADGPSFYEGLIKAANASGEWTKDGVDQSGPPDGQNAYFRHLAPPPAELGLRLQQGVVFLGISRPRHLIVQTATRGSASNTGSTPASGSYSPLPAPQRTVDPNLGATTVRYSVENRTPYELHLRLTGPVSQEFRVPSGATQAQLLPAGAYTVLGETTLASVLPFYGQQTYSGGAEYRSTFYISAK